MKTLLLNGCSFGECWTPTQQFIEAIGCDNFVNLSKPGTSFQRTCRSTIEWVAQNEKPDFVLIPITFAHRWELALNEDEDDIDGSWLPLQNSNFLSDDYKIQDSSVDDVKKLVDQYYRIIPTIKTYWDKMFTDIITFSAFLEKQKINYLMWDMCNDFDKKHIKDYKGFDKLKLIASNDSIIDLFEFCGNKYMWDSMEDNDGVDFNIHHAPDQYKNLENYLSTQINQ